MSDVIQRALELTDEDQEGFEDTAAPDAAWRRPGDDASQYDMVDHSPAASRYREDADGSGS